MSLKKRKQQGSFNLAFLDIMFCGFGAVVLLVLILNSSTVQKREVLHEDLRAELDRLQLEQSIYTKQLNKQQQEVKHNEQKLTALASQKNELSNLISSELKQQDSLREKQKNIRAKTEQAKSDLDTLAQKKNSKLQEINEAQNKGDKVRKFVGDGNRQYLTGLKLGGKRVLILLDSSASMLDKTVVSIIRRKIMSDEIKRQAPKWQRAISTVRWIVANLPPESSFQIHSFNTTSTPLPKEKYNHWTKSTENEDVSAIINDLTSLSPIGGTSLFNAFQEIGKISPRPDNIILITDGLPTQGYQLSTKTKIDGNERVKLFLKAIKELPSNIPVNTILFPMEGDPMAAMLFWKLGIDSKGSFFTPTKDWP